MQNADNISEAVKNAPCNIPATLKRLESTMGLFYF